MVDASAPDDAPLESTMIGFTARENRVGLVLFWMLIVGITVFFAGLLYTIADWIQPTGKASIFLAFPTGLQIIIIGAFMFGFFMLFVAFTVTYNRGTKAITRAMFAAEKMYREIKPTMGARFVTAGFMISVFVIVAGILVGIIQTAIANRTGGSGFLAFLESLTVGETIFAFASLYLILILSIIAVIWLWNQGTIFFQKRFFSKG